MTNRTLDTYSWLSLLRAFGVILVLGFHFFGSFVPGGFIGVDVFFVFSGYLITSLLVREFLEAGRVSLLAFYKRRFRRLAPALVTMIVVTMVLALSISADFRADIAHQIAASLGWVTNFYEIASGQSYADTLLPHLFTHTWTLAIEMQYYLVWGAVVTVLLPLFVLNTASGGYTIRRSRRVIAIAAVAVAVFSYLAMQVMVFGVEDPSSAYYHTVSHLYPLMIGSALGALAGFRQTTLVRISAGIRPVVSLALCAISLLLIVAMALGWSFTDPLVYHLGILATSLLVGLVILLGRGAQQRLSSYREPKLLLYLADRSYSIYLFHWPLYIIVNQWLHTLMPTAATAAEDRAILLLIAAIALVLTFVSAHLCYRFIERPFSRHRAQKASRARHTVNSRKRWVGAFVAAAVVVAMVFSVQTAPPRSTIELGYQHGEMVLDLTQLTTARQAFATLAEAGSRSGAPGPEIIPGSITIVGDSVTLRAVEQLQSLAGAQVDAAISRAMVNGIALIEGMEQNKTLGEYVVVALATNSHADSYESALAIIQNLAPGHRLIFLTAHGDTAMADLSAQLRTLPGQYPFVTIADWDGAISGKEHLLALDGYHMNDQEAVDIYVEVIGKAIEEARWKPTS
ncbi:MAG: acyltransferase [Coriobacteriales bacterium]|jgi:peptidoglycan/LPS O-acetylase OafA/YrhL|nr:acyltransferase [Coriobacteriales bacterium]